MRTDPRRDPVGQVRRGVDRRERGRAARTSSALEKAGHDHQIEQVGAELRAMMPWISAGQDPGAGRLGRPGLITPEFRLDRSTFGPVGCAASSAGTRPARGRGETMTDGRVGIRDAPDPCRAGARPGHRGAGRADLPDDRRTCSATPTHAANLFALAEIGNIYTRIMNPTQGVFEGAHRRLEGATETAIGIPGRAGGGQRPGGRDAGHPEPGRDGQPHRGVGRALRRHLQPAALHAAQARHRDHLHRRPRRPRRLAGRGAAQHQGVLRRDHRQPPQRRPRPRRRVGRGPRDRRAADRGQHGGHART